MPNKDISESFKELVRRGSWREVETMILKTPSKETVDAYVRYLISRNGIRRDTLRSILDAVVEKFNKGAEATIGNDIVSHSWDSFLKKSVKREALFAFTDVYITFLARNRDTRTVHRSCKQFLHSVWNRTDLDDTDKLNIVVDVCNKASPKTMTNTICQLLFVGAPYEAVVAFHSMDETAITKYDKSIRTNPVMVLSRVLGPEALTDDEYSVCKFVCHHMPKDALYEKEGGTGKIAIKIVQNMQLFWLLKSMHEEPFFNKISNKLVEARSSKKSDDTTGNGRNATIPTCTDDHSALDSEFEKANATIKISESEVDNRGTTTAQIDGKTKGLQVELNHGGKKPRVG